MSERGQTNFIYVDANPIIYAVEGNDSLANSIKELFDRFRAQPGLAITSELPLAEVLPKAPKPEHRQLYLLLTIGSGIINLVPVSREILIETADYRRLAAITRPDGGRVMPRLPDAIHVVTAIRSGCKRFLSADAGIRLPVDIKFLRADLAGIAGLLQELS